MRELFSVSAHLKNLYNELVPADSRRNIASPADADSSFEPPTVQELRDALLSEASLSRELLPALKAITESGRRYLAATEDMTARERFAGFVEISLEAYADRAPKRALSCSGFLLTSIRTSRCSFFSFRRIRAASKAGTPCSLKTGRPTRIALP